MPKTAKQSSDKASTTAASKSVNKSAFVRGLPNLSADEILAKGKAEGIVLSRAQIYTIRTNAKHKAGRRNSGAPRPQGRPPKAAAAPTTESRLASLAFEVGIGNAQELLRRLRSAGRNVAQG
jgi:hypothetical protein